jgi:hypothetical protein
MAQMYVDERKERFKQKRKLTENNALEIGKLIPLREKEIRAPFLLPQKEKQDFR